MDLEVSSGTESDITGTPLPGLEDDSFYGFWKEALREFNKENLSSVIEIMKTEVLPSIYVEARKLFNKPPIRAFLLLPINSFLENFSAITAHDTPGGVSRGRLLLAYTRMFLSNLVSNKDTLH